MKKNLICCLCLALALWALPALAEPAWSPMPWTIVTISDGLTADFDHDETEETFHFVSSLDEYNDGDFMLAVGSAAVMQENCCYLADEVYAMRVGWTGGGLTEDDYYATLFMVPEYGPSDDPYTYCYLYANGELTDVGGIPSVPEGMNVDPLTGTITTNVRATMVGTWSRPADYILASGFHWSEETDDGEVYYRLAEVPRPIYPFGMIVSLNEELPLLASQTDRVYAATLTPEANSRVILAATDDIRWLYVTSLDGETAGWVKMNREDYATMLTVGDEEMHAGEVFGDIIYAD